ncbi:MAG: hypothetical protein N3G80_01230 [Candidatus Micrarchaeota archaeon]|nr:hypothetical protein [Candidatus Micrarchaeota archaeon]
MRKAAAFCPAYITGIFTIGKGDAAGAGVSLEEGMTTHVHEASKTAVKINGRANSAPVSRQVIKEYQKLYRFFAKVEHQSRLPIGYGLGMSAAGALSLSLALNELLGAGLSYAQCVKIAHDAEVKCGTGLSGVDAAAIGGFLLRRNLKEKPIEIPIERKRLHIAFFAPIKTAQIVWDEQMKRKVNQAGQAALNGLAANPSWEAFIRYCRQFALESGLAGWCESILEKNESSSMAMLGRTIFSERALWLPSKPKYYMKVAACKKNAHVLR